MLRTVLILLAPFCLLSLSFLNSAHSQDEKSVCAQSFLPNLEEKMQLDRFEVTESDLSAWTAGALAKSETSFWVENAFSERFVVRFQMISNESLPANNIYRERFISQLFNQIPDVRVSQTKILDENQTEAIRRLILKQDSLGGKLRRLKSRLMGYSPVLDSKNISVSIHHRGMAGKLYIANTTPYDGEKTFKIKDLSDIPKPILQKISSYWLLYLIFGYYDFHPGNWMTDGSDVIGIDLAMDPEEVSTKKLSPEVKLFDPKSNPLIYPLYFWPLDVQFDHGYPEFEVLFSNILPSVRQFVIDLTPMWLLQESSRLGYELSEQDFDDIRLRLSAAQTTLLLRSDEP